MQSGGAAGVSRRGPQSSPAAPPLHQPCITSLRRDSFAMKHQKWVIVLAAAGIATTMAACGSSSSNETGNTSSQSPAATSDNATNDSSSPAGSAAAFDVSKPTTITVNCEPPTTAASQRKQWLDDVASFEKLHPNITIESKDEAPCDDPNTFSAK